ncbi:hypothetical protein [Bacillus alveayuensis]|jgi:hypothetical protein|uniref:hypothetical protein n=1 Tax=Aeribacillus alveayuensis TaxID=279215 RepID=UPI000A59B2CA|nr:hypothetical protein [Bacillus alveayuensis]
MGRGKSFQHKKKGHKSKVPNHGIPVQGKHTKDVEFSIDTSSSNGKKPISIQIDDDSQ